MGWQEEVVSALDAWVTHEGVPAREPRWRPLGRAVRGRTPGEFVIDVRGSDAGTDQLHGDGLRLAGAEENGVDAAHAVLDVFKDGTALRVRVAEFADPPDPHLWMTPQLTGFLVKALREGMAGLTEAPLAHLMARGEAGAGRLAPTGVPGDVLMPAQDLAYRACTGEGLWLVWGPPGTGKTTVLKRAIGDLVARGKRILLVSATNIAVDNALWGVVKERRHTDGRIVRVGPPHLREIAEDPHVCLTLMVRERLAGTDAQRRAVAAQLLAARERARHLAELEGSLTDFDAVTYAADRTRLDDLDQLKGWAKRRAKHDREAARSRLEAAREEAGKAEQRAADARAVRDRGQEKLARRLAGLRARTPFSRQEIALRQETLCSVEGELQKAGRAANAASALLVPLGKEIGLAKAAEARVAEADRLGHPQRHALVVGARPQVAQDEQQRPALERRHRELQEQYDKLSRDAQGEIIRARKWWPPRSRGSGPTRRSSRGSTTSSSSTRPARPPRPRSSSPWARRGPRPYCSGTSCSSVPSSPAWTARSGPMSPDGCSARSSSTSVSSRPRRP
ncbi:hypothetical protein HOK021_60560 [Streptomyces hygroscopicus]|nr:AAA domain-containing protein [Streptomyces hygroscopicus]BDH14877.1 hypothetical protein HOK021_60560 [Streptomyces hygroscopicus]